MRSGVAEQQRALAEVVQQQRRQTRARTSRAMGLRAEVTHVGVEGLAAGDDEEDGAEREEPVEPVVLKEAHAVDGVDRLEAPRDCR